jgi:NAD(P)-dependent dehydrogenase (short-subunit alcohol dehydrogenase family)
MAIELAPHNIQVNAIAPGWIVTDMTATPMKLMNEEILARNPAGRWGQPEEVAGTAVYWPRGRLTLLPVLRFVSMAATPSGNSLSIIFGGDQL